MLNTFIVYNGMLFGSVLFAFLSRVVKGKWVRKTMLLTTFLFLFLVSALRTGVGADFENYEYIFYTIDRYGLDTFEPLFLILNKSLLLLGLPAQSLFVVMAFIVSYFVVKSASKSRYPELLLLYYCIAFYFDSLNIVRQGAAMAISLYALICLIEGRKSHFIGYIFLATSLHYASILFLPAILFTKIKFNRWTMLLMFLVVVLITRVSILSYFSQINLLSGSKYSGYISSDLYNFEGGLQTTLTYLIRYIVVIIVFFIPRGLYPPSLERFRSMTLFLNAMLLLSIVIFNQFYGFHRFVTQLSISAILSLELISQAKFKWRQIFILICVMLPLILFERDIAVFIKGVPGKGISPYRTVLDKR